MKVTIITDFHAETMGYIGNCLPPPIARAGHETHLVTSDLQPYYSSPSYAETYEPFLGPPVVGTGTKEVDGYTLHRLPHFEFRGRLGLRGLGKTLAQIRPDVVQVLTHVSLTALQVSALKVRLGFSLLTANHMLTSVFPPATRELRNLERMKLFLSLWLPGRLVSLFTCKCHAPTPDAAYIAERFFGVQRSKIVITPLGTDTRHFFPVKDADSIKARRRLRESLGITDAEILCLYAGRFSEGKDPLLLAKAIQKVREEGRRFKGVFLGAGPQEDEINGTAGCQVHPFQSFNELPRWYRAADVAVWPRQESTSMLDAAACGLPIIISDQVQATERVSGNGLTYREGDVADLARRLIEMEQPAVRTRLGEVGASKGAGEFSWDIRAEERMRDFIECSVDKVRLG